MVKGTTRRVVVLKSPDPHVFDEAIFIVKEDAACHGVTNTQILREAQSVAEKYIMSQSSPKSRLISRIPPQGFALLGAGITAIIWALTSFLL